MILDRKALFFFSSYTLLLTFIIVTFRLCIHIFSICNYGYLSLIYYEKHFASTLYTNYNQFLQLECIYCMGFFLQRILASKADNHLLLSLSLSLPLAPPISLSLPTSLSLSHLSPVKSHFIYIVSCFVNHQTCTRIYETMDIGRGIVAKRCHQGY